MLRWTRARALLWASLACVGGACTLSVDGTAPTGGLGVAGAFTGDGAGGVKTTSGAGGASAGGAHASGAHAGGATTTSSTAAGGAGGAPCPAAQKRCDGACVTIDPENGCDPATCEPCASNGHATMTCDFDACAVLACDDGWADCDGDPGNACESSLADEQSCGACGVICPGGADCVKGVCTCTDPGYALCGDECRYVLDDPLNCGGCGVECGPDRTCSGPTCVCVEGLTECGNGCVDLERDEANCGACGTVADCAGCGKDCCCHGAPVDTCSSDKNCGGCGHDCPSDKKCEKGACVKKGP